MGGLLSSGTATLHPKGSKSGQKDSALQSKKQQSISEPIVYDVAITFSEKDKAVAEELSQSLSNHGLVCVMDDAESQAGPAISSGTSLIWVLTENSVSSNYCCDRIALAYIANVSIIPVHLSPRAALKEKLEFGTKLVLQVVKWFDITDSATRGEQLTAIGDQIVGKKNQPESTQDTTEASEQLKHVSHRHRPVHQITIQTDPTYDFWGRKLGSDEVAWFRFEKSLVEEFDEELKSQFSDKQIDWLLKTLKKEIFFDSEQARKQDFLEFTGNNPGKDYLIKRIILLATEKLAMIDVFSMKSTVRLQAIDNLTRFSTPAVMQSLNELLSETDANVRTVACITVGKLGHAGVELSPGTLDSLMINLADKDRLVREAACITLGRLKATQAIEPILNLWRNDFIHTVRVAASNALKQMDSEKANEAVYLTEKLLSEVKALSEEN